MAITLQTEIITCCSCAFAFSVPKHWNDARKNDHRIWFCPACGTRQHFAGETDAEKYKRLWQDARTDLARERNRLESMERRFYGMKGYATSLKNRLNHK